MIASVTLKDSLAEFEVLHLIFSKRIIVEENKIAKFSIVI